jgi:hypothetical protein
MSHKYSKTDGAPIDHNAAKFQMKKFRDKYPEKDAVIARFIGSDIIHKILKHPEAVGLRVYFGDDDRDQMEIFFVGVREDGSNIWPGAGKDGGGGTIADHTFPCPPYCPPPAGS